MKKLIVLAGMMLTCLLAVAQKTVYIPNEWKNPWPADSLLYAENDPDNKYTWSKSRSVESDNVIVFWDKGYGTKKPSESPSAYRVDEQDLLKKCEAFYDLEINHLGFVDPETSNIAKYKVMVLLNHTTDWVCYGGGYDFQISALWLGPSACKPVGHSVAHEVGHSFHYMCYAEHSKHKDSQTDNTGFHLACGNGQAIWEQTAQWQAAQSYPELMYDQSINVFRKSHNYAFSHEWHRYQSYWFHYYLCQHYGDLTTVAQVWNQPMTGQSSGNATDFNQALMKLKGLDATGLFRLYHDYASRCVTWDFDACVPYRDPYIGSFEYRCVQLPSSSYQVALASTPQSSGFNIIPLQVPEAGTKVTTHFTALKSGARLADADPAEMMNGETQWGHVNRTTYISNSNAYYRGFRLGYVALMSDGTRQYFSEDSVYCTGTDEKTEDVTLTVPDGVSRLWLIVTPAPRKYVQHKWTEKVTNAEQWPYAFQLEGTDLAPQATVYVQPTLDGRDVSDVTLTYDVNFPYSSSDYSGLTVNISGQAAATLATALQLNPSEIGSRLQAYAANGPSEGYLMFYPCNPKTGTIVKRASTANGYGHWFSASGNVSDYPSGYVYSEFNPSSLAFALGQYPGKCRSGSTYTVSQALHYRQSSTASATARFVFNITVGPAAAATLRSIDYQDPTTGIEAMEKGRLSSDSCQLSTDDKVYDLRGQEVTGSTNANSRQPRGIYIISGRKTVK